MQTNRISKLFKILPITIVLGFSQSIHSEYNEDYSCISFETARNIIFVNLNSDTGFVHETFQDTLDMMETLRPYSSGYGKDGYSTGKFLKSRNFEYSAQVDCYGVFEEGKVIDDFYTPFKSVGRTTQIKGVSND